MRLMCESRARWQVAKKTGQTAGEEKRDGSPSGGGLHSLNQVVEVGPGNRGFFAAQQGD
jgi:hypothetical protein